MTKEILQENLAKIKECDFIRCLQDGDNAVLYFVGDNEPCSDHDHDHEHDHDDDEEEEEDEDDDCCCGMNGHLFKIVFHGVADYSSVGEEGDSYRYQETDIQKNSLRLVLNGMSFAGSSGPLSISFSFKDYSVEDLGKIESPEA